MAGTIVQMTGMYILYAGALHSTSYNMVSQAQLEVAPRQIKIKYQQTKILVEEKGHGEKRERKRERINSGSCLKQCC